MSLIIPANTLASGGYEVDNSLRFNRGSSDNLTRTPSSASNRRTFTLSFWVKRADLGSGNRVPFAIGNSSSSTSDADWFTLMFHGSTNTLRLVQYNNQLFNTNRVFRDSSACYHIVIAVDTTQGTDTNRMKVYVNGVQETSFSTVNYPSENYDFVVNTAVPHRIGREDGNGSVYFSGYLSEYCFIDGTQNAVTDFGEFDEDSGIWKPIDVSGLTFGTNGFYLEFKQSGTGTNASGMGADTSGNTNHFAVNNLTAIDQSTDTCTNNFATLNPLDVNGIVLSEGNLNAGSTGATWRSTRGTFGMSSGKWYWEMKIIGGNTPIDAQIGVGSFELAIASNGEWSSANPSVAYSSGDGSKKVNGTSSSYGASFTTGDIIGVAFDVDNLNVTFYKNGASQGAITTGFSASDTFACEVAFYGRGGGTTNGSFNFGSPPYAISSGNTDGDGYGNFEYAVPSGYFSLNTKNLAEYG